MGFPKPLDFDFADCFAYPFGGTWLSRPQEYLGGGLREHGLSILPVPSFHLAATLEAEDDGILRFPVFGDSGMKLRQTLQTGQFIDHKPNRILAGHRFIQEDETKSYYREPYSRPQVP